eukprot:1322756-Amorphochlora_amoeboformis.AAC.1
MSSTTTIVQPKELTSERRAYHGSQAPLPLPSDPPWGPGAGILPLPFGEKSYPSTGRRKPSNSRRKALCFDLKPAFGTKESGPGSICLGFRDLWRVREKITNPYYSTMGGGKGENDGSMMFFGG